METLLKNTLFVKIKMIVSTEHARHDEDIITWFKERGWGPSQGTPSRYSVSEGEDLGLSGILASSQAM